MVSPPRVAFFTDTFNEINGVALTSRQLTEFARKREYPFLCIRGAEKSRKTHDYGATHIELARGPFGFSLDKGLRHEPARVRSDASRQVPRLDGQHAKGAISQVCEDLILDAVIRFSKLGEVLFAPNEELVEMLQRLTGKPVFLMKRGIARRPKRTSASSAISTPDCMPQVCRRSGS